MSRTVTVTQTPSSSSPPPQPISLQTSPVEQEVQPPAQLPKIARARPIQQQLLVKKETPANRNYETRKIAPRRNALRHKRQASKMPQDQIKKKLLQSSCL